MLFSGTKKETRERKMRTNFLNNLRGPGHLGKISGTSQMPLFETQGRQTFEGTNFSATTPSRGGPAPHRAVSGPKKLIFLLFFLEPENQQGPLGLNSTAASVTSFPLVFSNQGISFMLRVFSAVFLCSVFFSPHLPCESSEAKFR